MRTGRPVRKETPYKIIVHTNGGRRYASTKIAVIGEDGKKLEFGIRDAKQFTGLQSQQTRDKARLDFAFNLSFMALNVCKEVIRKDYPNLSVAQFKRFMFESYLASTIISTY